MNRGELRPRHRDHLRRRVQLHGAGAQRDHRRVEADVLALQRLDVAHHLGFRMMRIEDRVRQVARRAPQRRRQIVTAGGKRRRGGLPSRLGEGRDDVQGILVRHRLVERDADAAVGVPQIDPSLLRRRPDGGSVSAFDPEGVEVMGIRLPVSERGQRPADAGSRLMHARGDRSQAGRSVVHRIHRRDVRQQRLRRADVRGRLLPPDVLLASLQRHPVGLMAVAVDRQADDPAGRLTDVGVTRRQERRVGTAAAERHAEALRVADDGVGAQLARRRQQGQRQQVRRDNHEHACGMRLLDDGPEIGDGAALVRVLQQQAKGTAERLVGQPRRVAGFNRDVEGLRPAADDVQGLRIAPVRDQERFAAAAAALRALNAMEHRHRLGGGRTLVEQRRRRDVHGREILHDRLEVQQRFQPTLRDLRLIGRVRRVPPRVLEHVAQDHARRDAAVVAEADVGARDDVRSRDTLQPAQVDMFGFAVGQVERRAGADTRRNRLIDEGVERRHADGVEHGAARRRVRADVPGSEGTGGLWHLLGEFRVLSRVEQAVDFAGSGSRPDRNHP